MDMFIFKFDCYFDEVCDFIVKVVGIKNFEKFNGKIYVYCKEGVS